MNEAAKYMIKYHTLPITYALQIILLFSLSACHDHTQIEPLPIINNIAPVATQVAIIPPSQPNESITASYIYTDQHDLEGSSSFSWLIDDIVIANTLSFILPSDSEGKYLTFCVTPVAKTGDVTQGEEVCVEHLVEGNYTKPTINTLVLTSPMTTGIEISADYLFIDENERSEGDSVYSWKINNSELSSEKVITLAIEQQGNLLTLCITPIATSGENATGEAVCSDEILITAKVGSAPSIENLQLVNFAKAGNDISILYEYADVDGDLAAENVVTWSIAGTEISQEETITLPNDSAGKLLSVCVTPNANTGLPTVGTKVCIEKHIAEIIITGELELYKTINLSIAGYTHNGVTWRILHPSYSPVRSTDSSAFTITGNTPIEEANWLIGHDLEVCIDTVEDGEICLLASEQATTQITGGLPTEFDTDNNITKRVIAPVSFIDLTISGVTKRLHRPLTVTESTLLNLSSAGAVPLHNGQYTDANTSIVWAIYNWQTATDSCINQGMSLPVQGVSDISDAFGLHQFYNQTAISYSNYPSSYIVRGMGWPGIYYRSSSFHSAGKHYDYYLVTGSDDFISDNTSEGAACLSLVP